MKNIIAILTFVFTSVFGLAQAGEKGKADSLSYLSRLRADVILSRFDSINSTKMLYSISDEQYLIILKNGCCYKEYYIHTDSTGKIIIQRVIKTSKKNEKLLTDAFNLNNYNKEKFITKADNPTVVLGNLSYFVVKDIQGERYGEYSLSTLTVPIPIDKKLYNYLLARLLRETTKNR